MLCDLHLNMYFYILAGFDWKSTRLLFTFFWHRLLGSGGIWFCNDWYFYGNGVFRSTFVGILVGPEASVQVNWLYSYINAGVQLVGYYCAALTVDFRWIGRRRLTVFSFIMVSRSCHAESLPDRMSCIVKVCSSSWWWSRRQGVVSNPGLACLLG